MCVDTINNDIVATVGRNTNDALVEVVDDKLQDVSYPCPHSHYDVVNSTLLPLCVILRDLNQ